MAVNVLKYRFRFVSTLRESFTFDASVCYTHHRIACPQDAQQISLHELTISVKLVCTGFWWGNLRENDRWGDPDVDGRIILRWIFRKWEGVVGTGWCWLRIVTGGGHL